MKNESSLSTIELGRFQTDIIIKDTLRSKVDLLTQTDQVLNFVKKHINKEVIITGNSHNIKKWQYPLEAIREIIMNMIVHRDYRSSSDSIVKIYNHKIEFYNPGRLPATISIDDLMTNNYKSAPRNKLITDFCKNLGLIEKYGSGIRRIINYFDAEHLPIPVFQNISDGFMVTIFSSPDDNVTDNRYVTLLKLVTENREISTTEIANHLQVARRTVARDIEYLKQNNLLRRIGPDKGGYWQVLTK